MLQGDDVIEGNRSSVIVTIDDRAGSLQDMLRLFAEYNVNMTRIESKPSNL